jgi:hypothetical protein
MSNSYKGYSLFNDIKDTKLRTWNRCATAFNINTDGDCDGYVACLDDVCKRQVHAMLKYINVLGLDKARRKLFGGLKEVV